MHLMQLTPAILLALASVGSARPAANTNVTAYEAILEASPAALVRTVQNNEVFLTKDNSCGKMGAGKNHGWYCDPMKDKGGACCSSDGWCGNGPKYCEAGCQTDFGHCDKRVSKPPKPVIKCGPKNKNKKCNNDECCSVNGFCGKNRNFCDIGCQDQFGKCEAKLKPEPVNPKPKPAPKPIQRRCGPANNNQKCPGLDCCSHAGYCGIGTGFCAVPQNCLRGFGRCDSDMFPAGASTIKDPRPQLGKIEYGKYIMDCKEPGTVAMTFDDGPNVYTSELLDKLKVAEAKATFMIGGNNNGRQIDQGDVWPKLLKRMIAEGHQIASHTWSHPHMNAMKSEDRKLEMAKTERAIANIIGKYPTYMRPPYSECNEKSGCQKDMKDMGYSLVGLTFDTLDWKNAAGHIQDSTQLVEEYFDKLGPDGHALICQHDILGASVQELTPIILNIIKDKGFKGIL